MAPVNLDREARHLDRDFARQRLADRQQEPGLVAPGAVEQGGGLVAQSAYAAGERLHPEQGPPDVGMFDDGGRRAAAAALDAFRGVARGLVEGGAGDAHPFERDLEPHRVDHREHVLDAALRFPEQVAGRAVEPHLAGGRAVDPHLLLDARGGNGIARTERPVGFHRHARDEEQAEPPDARRRALDARQYDVSVLRGSVMVAEGDEDLGAGERIAPIGLRRRDGPGLPDIGARVRLGHDDGSRPFAAREPGHPEGLNVGAGVREEHPRRRPSAHRQHGEGKRGPVRHLGHRGLGDLRHRLAAIFLRQGEARPSAGAKRLIGFDEAGRQADRAVLQRGADPVRGVVHRRYDLRCDPARLADRRLEGFRIDMGEFRPGEDDVGTDRLAQQEQDVVYRGAVGHGRLNSAVASRSSSRVSGSTATR